MGALDGRGGLVAAVEEGRGDGLPGRPVADAQPHVPQRGPDEIAGLLRVGVRQQPRHLVDAAVLAARALVVGQLPQVVVDPLEGQRLREQRLLGGVVDRPGGGVAQVAGLPPDGLDLLGRHARRRLDGLGRQARGHPEVGVDPRLEDLPPDRPDQWSQLVVVDGRQHLGQRLDLLEVRVRRVELPVDRHRVGVLHRPLIRPPPS